MLASIKVIGVTGCTGARIVKPECNVLVIIAVARNASHRRIVVTRIVAVVGMIVINRRPAIGRVTRVAIRCGNKMIPTLTGCRITIMTGHTVTRDALVVPGTTHESGRGMTEMAIQTSRNVISRFTRSGYTMTGSTIVHNAGMIEHRAAETTRRMTNTAILVSGRMVTCFAGGEYPIVAGLAVVHDTLMIKRSGEETRGHMTLTAIIVGGHMVGGFASGIGAIVTGSAVIHDTGVIKTGASKGRCVMAHGTVFRSGYVIRWFTGSVCTVVTGSAVVYDSRMIKHRRRKITRHVTDAAIIVGRNMVVILAGGIITVMT